MPRAPRLLLFTRYPEAGRCKTRLIPVLGPQGAAQLQRRMTERLVAEAISVQAAGLGLLSIHHHGASEEEMAAWLGPLPFVPQVEGDLGRRMAAAFAHAFAGEATAAVLFGSDIPDLDGGLLRQALAALEEVPVVIGPTRDGGYYLIGLTAAAFPQLPPLLFTDIAWSTEEVLATTRERLRRQGIAHTLLEELADVDTPDGLPLARAKGLL